MSNADAASGPNEEPAWEEPSFFLDAYHYEAPNEEGHLEESKDHEVVWDPLVTGQTSSSQVETDIATLLPQFEPQSKAPKQHPLLQTWRKLPPVHPRPTEELMLNPYHLGSAQRPKGPRFLSQNDLEKLHPGPYGVFHLGVGVGSDGTRKWQWQRPTAWQRLGESVDVRSRSEPYNPQQQDLQADQVNSPQQQVPRPQEGHAAQSPAQLSMPALQGGYMPPPAQQHAEIPQQPQGYTQGQNQAQGLPTTNGSPAPGHPAPGLPAPLGQPRPLSQQALTTGLSEQAQAHTIARAAGTVGAPGAHEGVRRPLPFPGWAADADVRQFQIECFNWLGQQHRNQQAVASQSLATPPGPRSVDSSDRGAVPGGWRPQARVYDSSDRFVEPWYATRNPGWAPMDDVKRAELGFGTYRPARGTE